MSKLIPESERCEPCESGKGRIALADLLEALEALEGWEVRESPESLVRLFRFRHFHETMAFVNAVAWIAHSQNHHPTLRVGYRECEVAWTTHATGGLTRNDLVCAGAVNRLLPRVGPEEGAAR